MAIVTNGINLGTDGVMPPGDAANQTWNFSGVFAVQSAADVSIDTATILNLGATTTTHINLGNSIGDLVCNMNVFSLNATSISWNVTSFFQIISGGFVFAGTAGANLVFNSPQVAIEGASLGIYSTNVQIGTGVETLDAGVDSVNFLVKTTLALDNDSTGGGVINIGTQYAADIFVGSATVALALTALSYKLNSIPSSVTGFTLYYDPSTAIMTYGAAPTGGGTFDPSANYTITGNWTFQAGFDISAPNAISLVTTGAGNTVTLTSTDDSLNLNSQTDSLYQSAAGNLTLQALTAGKQIQLYADGFNFSSTVDANFNSTTGNLNIDAVAGTINFGALNAYTSVTNNIGLSTTGAGDININTANGGLNFYSTTGDVNLNAGNGSTSGNLNLGTGLGTTSINSHDDVNLNSSIGQINLNSSASNISVAPSGLSMGVNAGSGMNIDAVTGNFQFGAGAGAFLLGTTGSTVTILGHLGISLTADLNDVDLTATGGSIILTAGTAATITAPAVTIDGTLLSIPNLGTQTGAVAIPANRQPAGWQTVIWNSTTHQFAVYTQT